MKKILYIIFILVMVTLAKSSFAQTALPTYVAPTPAATLAAPVVTPPPATYTPAAVTTSNTSAAPGAGSVLIPTVKPVESVSIIKPVVQKTSAVVDPLSSLNAPGAKTKASGELNNNSNSTEPNTVELQQLAVNTKTASSALGNALTKLSGARDKIAARISLAKNKGAQDALVTNLQSKLSASDSKLSDAKSLVDNIAIVPVSQGNLSAIIATLQAEDNVARASIRQAQDSLRDVLASLIAVESTLKK